MRTLLDKLLKKEWFQGLLIFLPFTGIINPYWYVFLFLVYFFVGTWYIGSNWMSRGDE